MTKTDIMNGLHLSVTIMARFGRLIATGLLLLTIGGTVWLTVAATAERSGEGVPTVMADTATSSPSTTDSSGAATANPTDKKTIQDQMVEMMGFLVMVQKVLYALLVPVIAFMGKLLSNDWVLGKDFGIAETMQNLWMLIRNLVNMVFVVIIIMMAFYALFGKSDDKALGAKGLKNLILAIVLVNFSFFFVKVALDGANLLTTFAFSIPGEVGQVGILNEKSYNPLGQYYPLTYYNDMTGREECAMYKNYVINLDAKFGKNGTDEVIYPISVKDAKKITGTAPSQTVADTKKLIIDNDSSITANCNVDLSNTFFSARTAMYAYAFNLLRLPEFNQAVSTNATVDGTIVSLALGIVIILLFAVVTFAMFLAFAVRMVMLWVYIICSPLLIVMNVMKGAFGKMLGDKLSKMMGLNEFLALAFMPAMVGLVISVGYLLLSTVNSGLASMDAKNSLELGVVTFHFKSIMLAGFPSIMHLILAFLAIAFLWAGVFAAMSRNAVVKQVTSGLEKWGSDLGKFVVKAPKYVPFIPFKGKTMSAAELGQLSRQYNPETIMDQKIRSELAAKYPEFDRLASSNKDVTKALNNLRDAVNKKEGDLNTSDLEAIKTNLGKVNSPDFLKHQKDVILPAVNVLANKGTAADKQVYEEAEQLIRAGKYEEAAEKLKSVVGNVSKGEGGYNIQVINKGDDKIKLYPGAGLSETVTIAVKRISDIQNANDLVAEMKKVNTELYGKGIRDNNARKAWVEQIITKVQGVNDNLGNVTLTPSDWQSILNAK